MSAPKRGELIQVDPPGPTLRFRWNPRQLLREPRKPRFATIERPHRVSALEWEGKTPFTLRFQLRLDGFPDESVEPDIARLEGFAAVHPNRPPPRLRLRYAGFSPVLYIITELSYGEEVRRADLARVRVDVDISLLEYQTAEVIPTPARRQAERPAPSTPAVGTHTVRAGDTLWSIAQRELGDGRRHTDIAELNGIRDPNRINVGQTLRIPPR